VQVPLSVPLQYDPAAQVPAQQGWFTPPQETHSRSLHASDPLLHFVPLQQGWFVPPQVEEQVPPAPVQ